MAATLRPYKPRQKLNVYNNSFPLLPSPRRAAMIFTTAVIVSLAAGTFAAPAASSSFVKTSGTEFTLDGARYTVVGYVYFASAPTVLYIYADFHWQSECLLGGFERVQHHRYEHRVCRHCQSWRDYRQVRTLFCVEMLQY